MDSSFVWILMVAGATVALLGLFLVASERELKTKRREIEDLLTKLENNGVDRAGGQAPRQGANRAAEASEPRAQNREEPRDSDIRLHAEVSALRRTLDASQKRIRELEAAQRELPDVESIQAEHRRERESLHQRMTELEARRLADQEKLSELQSLRARLAEAESVQASLQEEIRRREAEVPAWQARIAAAEEQGQRLAALQRPCNELLSKQAALAEGQRRLQEELAAFARLMETTRQPPLSFGSTSSSNVATAGGDSAQNPLHTGPGATPDIAPAQAARPRETNTA